jgi:cytochrome o ubiquinol oxidase subunit 1
MPKNTETGVIIAALSTMLGFALVWYIWWLAALSFVAILAVAIRHTFNYDRDYFVSAEEVIRFESLRTAQLSARA